MKIAGVIAAAGDSERMGRTKALLPLGQDTFVTHLARTLARAGVSPIVVTLPDGESGELTRRALLGIDVDARPNARPAEGLAGSIATALDLIRHADALLVCPVDMPFVTPALVQKLASGLSARPGALAALPVVNDHAGHPALFARALFDELAVPELPGGAHAVLERHAEDVVEVPWGDERVLANINTPEEFERWIARD